MRFDPEEREKFREAFAETHPDLAAGEDAPSLVDHSFWAYLYRKTLSECRRDERLLSLSYARSWRG